MSTEYIVHGKVKFKGEEIQSTPNYTKRELVVTTEEQYPQDIMIEFPQGKCNNDFDKIKIGSKVTVSINLRGREWINPQGESKYFNTIQGWKMQYEAVGSNIPTGRKFVFTATDGTEEAYRANKWTTELMVQHNKGHYVDETPISIPTPAIPSAPVQQAPLAPVLKEEEHDDLPF